MNSTVFSTDEVKEFMPVPTFTPANAQAPLQKMQDMKGVDMPTSYWFNVECEPVLAKTGDIMIGFQISYALRERCVIVPLRSLNDFMKAKYEAAVNFLVSEKLFPDQQSIDIAFVEKFLDTKLFDLEEKLDQQRTVQVQNAVALLTTQGVDLSDVAKAAFTTENTYESDMRNQYLKLNHYSASDMFNLIFLSPRLVYRYLLVLGVLSEIIIRDDNDYVTQCKISTGRDQTVMDFTPETFPIKEESFVSLQLTANNLMDGDTNNKDRYCVAYLCTSLSEERTLRPVRLLKYTLMYTDRRSRKVYKLTRSPEVIPMARMLVSTKHSYSPIIPDETATSFAYIFKPSISENPKNRINICISLNDKNY